MHVPNSLYEICTKAAVEIVVKSSTRCDRELRSLPNSILFDCLYELYQEKHLCLLRRELRSVSVFNRLLSVSSKRTQLFRLYQAMLDHENKCVSITEALVADFQDLVDNGPRSYHLNLIEIGLRIAGFFNEGGWYSNCIRVTTIIEEFCNSCGRSQFVLMKLLECYHRRLHAEVAYKSLVSAEKTFGLIENVMVELGKHELPNLAAIYSNFSSLFYMKSDYNKAVQWSRKALKCLKTDSSPRVLIDVLRQASKACIVKRCFKQARFLIKQALRLATDLYAKDRHPNYADTLSDYGFYLLNSDSTEESVRVYMEALHIRQEVFDKYNINVALAHEDLAYVLYVHEYSSGSFSIASEHADLALKIMNKLLPSDHLLMASAKRVKALILEEIALDIPNFENSEIQDNYLKESEELHKEALASSYRTFGEKNVLTAKQFGNLGRLYQSMKKMEEAEEMHLKAIAIKEELLGANDYEVALSVGHLASLYNYQMSRYEDAEKLYLRSIEININLFGEAYSGLEYDYRGITHVYVKLADTEKVTLYEQKMRDWRILRRTVRTVELDDDVLPVRKIVDTFFEMC